MNAKMIRPEVPKADTETSEGAVVPSVVPDGIPRNGHAGYGYKLRGSKGRRTKVPDPKEQQVIRWIAEQRQAGWTWERIYLDLLRRRERTREGREWSVSRIRRAYADYQRRNGVYPEPVRRRHRKPRPRPNLAALVLHRVVRCLPRVRLR